MKIVKHLDGKVREEEDRAKAHEKAYFLLQDDKDQEKEEDRTEDASGLGKEDISKKKH